MKTTVISLGGSLIMPENINIDFLKRFRQLLLKHTENDVRFIIVCGGGRICRDYQSAAQHITKVSSEDRDWIGIMATKLNAELVRSVLSEQAYKRVIDNPSEKLNTDKRIIIGAGYRPGSSSDYDAVLLAENFKATTLINMSNIDMVYDKDPKQHSDSKAIRELSWDGLLSLTGERWLPGMNVPFDPVASRKAAKIGLKVIILNGNNLKNLRECLEAREFTGTIIS